MRRLLSLLLALTLVLTCNYAVAEGDDIVTYTWFARYRNENHSPMESTAFTATLEDAGIRFEFELVTGAAYEEKYRLKLASGDYPDIFDETDAEWYGAQEGVLLPLEDLFREYAPNICAALDKYNGWDVVDYSDGHIYNVPEINLPGARDNLLWVNKTWLDRLNLEVPQSFEEIYDVLTAFKEQDANGNGDAEDEIPLSCRIKSANDGCTFMQFANYEPYKFNLEFRLVIDEDGTTRFYPMTEEFKTLLDYCTKLYQEGLMNSDCFTLTQEAEAALVTTTDTVGMFFAMNPVSACGVDKAFDWVIVEPWCDSVEISNAVSRNGYCITDHCKEPERLIEWFDQFYTEDGAILAQLGVQGVTYDVNADGNWFWLEDGEQTGYYIRNTLVGGVPTCPSDFVEYNDVGSDAITVYVKQQWDAGSSHNNLVNPQLPFTDEDLQLGLPVMIDVNSYFPQYMADVMTGKLDLDESWDAFQQELVDMGAPVLEEVLQGCYDRMQ